MKNFNRTKKFFFALALTTIIQGCGKPTQSFSNLDSSDSSPTVDGGSADGDIFSSVSDEETEISDIEEVSGTKVHQRRTVKVNINALKKALEGSTGAITLNLFKGKSVRIQLDSISKLSNSNYVASGHVQGDLDSSVTLVLKDNVLLATVKSSQQEENYEVRFNGSSGHHTITEQVEIHDTEDSCAVVEAPASDEDPIVDPEAGGNESVLTVPILDILVAYTPAAKEKVGGTSAMQALIQLGIEDTNTALLGSGVNLKVRLVGTVALTKNETSNYSNDLSALKSSTDSRWNEVHTARAKYGADQVTLIGAYSNVSNPVGIGYFKATKSSAFTIVKYSVISSMFTFAHELGHNIGLDHSDGYVSSAGKFRTIMAYGTYKRIRRFSNPNIPYSGHATGSAYKYSAKIINTNSVRMSGLTPSLR